MQAETRVGTRRGGQDTAAVATGSSSYRGERRQPRKLGQGTSMSRVRARAREQADSRLYWSQFIPKAPACSAVTPGPFLPPRLSTRCSCCLQMPALCLPVNSQLNVVSSLTLCPVHSSH